MIRSTNSDLTRRRFTRDDYHGMAAAGILALDARVELLDGEIVEMSLIGPRHSAIVRLLNAFFSAKVASRAIVDIQNPIALDPESEPQPDLIILKPRADFYRDAHPQPSDVLLLIEVAESSLQKDRGEKLRLYAQAGIAEYWIIDVDQERLIVHRHPKGDEFTLVQQHDRSAGVAPTAFPEHVLELAPLFEFPRKAPGK